MDTDRKPSKIVNPDTGQPEEKFRELVRDVLGLDWSTRDAAIFAELKRLKTTVEALEENQRRQRKLASDAYRTLSEREVAQVHRSNYLTDENQHLREVEEQRRGGHGW